VHLHDEQGVQPLKSDGVEVEQVSGEQAVSLDLEEGSPLPVGRVAAGCRAQTGRAEDPADGGRADLVAEAAQFTVHAPEAPSGVLDAEPGDQLVQVFGQGGRPGDGVGSTCA